MGLDSAFAREACCGCWAVLELRCPSVPKLIEGNFMANLIHRLVALAACLLCVACGTRHLAPGSVVNADESLIVIGVKPIETIGLYVFPGDLRNDRFHVNPWLNAAIAGKGQDGYLVSKARTGQTLGVVRAFVWGQGPFAGTPYDACGDQKVAVFDVPAGEAIYIADFEFQPSGRLSVQLQNRLTEAAAMVDRDYPQFKGKLKQAPYKWVPTTTSCNPGPIFIFVPATR
ncbi:hypothetical protein ACO2Q9_01610 [Variovorax sp. VNK109]|uniref:hypothetical protein n=1 Tax=Variovorax sp. VNK109 TaxID=3400919 RepID=UPI003BFFA278